MCVKFVLMKRFFLYLLLAVAAVFPRVDAFASGDKVKTGWGLGPLPQVGYDADNGLNLGLQLNLNNYKDGKLYPNPYSTTYLNFAWYQKGIINLILSHDNRTMIPGVRFCTSIQYCNDNFQSFYGLNGYQSNYSPTLVDGSRRGSSIRPTSSSSISRSILSGPYCLTSAGRPDIILSGAGSPIRKGADIIPDASTATISCTACTGSGELFRCRS